jgi:hypothetical protein
MAGNQQYSLLFSLLSGNASGAAGHLDRGASLQ